MEVQPRNAWVPMDMTLEGMIKELSAEHPLNAPLPIERTVVGMVMDVNAEQPANMLSEIFVIPETSSTELSDLHPLYAPTAEVMLLGITVDVSAVQPLNAPSILAMTLPGA